MSRTSETQKKLLTIITEAALENTLIREIEKLGARGYTITDARGRGSRGTRGAGWEASSNIRIEVVCESDTATHIASFLEQNYYENYGMIVYLSDVQVLRSEKF